MNHTKEPWMIDSTAKLETQEQIDYHRAALCVNACAGVSGNWLDGYGKCLHAAKNSKNIRDNIEYLKSQRDEFLSAAKMAVRMWDDIYPDMESGKYPQERLEDAEFNEISVLRKLIAKCEAQS